MLKSRFIFGSNFNLKNINLSCDYNFFDNEYMLGANFNYNSLVSFQLGNSTFEKLYIGFLVELKKFNIGYSFVIPRYMELGTSQRILIGFNKDYLNLEL